MTPSLAAFNISVIIATVILAVHVSPVCLAGVFLLVYQPGESK